MNIRSITPSALAIAAITACAMLQCGTASAITSGITTWTGTNSSDWADNGNWTTATFPVTGEAPTARGIRIQVGATGNTTPPTLIYSAAQGHTIYNISGRSLVIANGAGTSGTVTITGGTYDSQGTQNDAIANAGGSGTLTISGGQYTNVNGGSSTFTLGLNFTGSTATLNVNSGSFTAGTLTVGEGTASGSAVNGIANLNGGILEVGNFSRRASSAISTVNFNGGTLRARQNNASFMGTADVDTASVQSGGAIIDTNTFDITIAQALTAGAGSGGLTKQSSGTLTLGGTNTYTGATLVSGGILSLGSAGSIATSSSINVASGATFNVSAVTGWTLGGSQTLGGSGTVVGGTTIDGLLSPGSSPGVLAFGDALTLNGTTLMEIDGATRGTQYDGIDTDTGALTYGGVLTLDFGSLFAPGNHVFDLFNIGTGGQTGDFSSVALTGEYSGALNNIGGGEWQRVDGGNTWTFSQSSGDLTFVAVPEPSIFALGATAIGLAAGIRRLTRRRRSIG